MGRSYGSASPYSTGGQSWEAGRYGSTRGSFSGQRGELNQRGQRYGRGPKGWRRSDERVRDDISERLADHPDIDASEIEVIVVEGVVTLNGAVDDRESKRLAEDIAESVSGVRDVQDQVRVNRGFWGTIKDTFTGKSGDESDRQRYGQQQTTPAETASSAAPTHTITPSPQQTSQSTTSSTTGWTKTPEPAGSRK